VWHGWLDHLHSTQQHHHHSTPQHMRMLGVDPANSHTPHPGVHSKYISGTCLVWRQASVGTTLQARTQHTCSFKPNQQSDKLHELRSRTHHHDRRSSTNYVTRRQPRCPLPAHPLHRTHSIYTKHTNTITSAHTVDNSTLGQQHTSGATTTDGTSECTVCTCSGDCGQTAHDDMIWGSWRQPKHLLLSKATVGQYIQYTSSCTSMYETTPLSSLFTGTVSSQSGVASETTVKQCTAG
jgi:hypothetical protein